MYVFAEAVSPCFKNKHVLDEELLSVVRTCDTNTSVSAWIAIDIFMNVRVYTRSNMILKLFISKSVHKTLLNSNVHVGTIFLFSCRVRLTLYTRRRGRMAEHMTIAKVWRSSTEFESVNRANTILSLFKSATQKIHLTCEPETCVRSTTRNPVEC